MGWDLNEFGEVLKRQGEEAQAKRDNLLEAVQWLDREVPLSSEATKIGELISHHHNWIQRVFTNGCTPEQAEDVKRSLGAIRKVFNKIGADSIQILAELDTELQAFEEQG